ncbi:MAG: hypothetical protein ABSF71_02110 [Terriglobia bacterium]|jgi:anti-sigma factor ChrR (cupin superfamily)
MKNLVHEILCSLRVLAGLHSRYEDLLAYRDGELGRVEHWCVETHLRRCPLCQREAKLIEEDLRTFVRMDHQFYASDFLNVPAGLGKLHQAIENWESQGLLDDEVPELDRTMGEAGLRQLETEFDLYLGTQATAAFLLKVESGQRKSPGLLKEAEAVFRDFLGPSAASAITQRILYAQMSMNKAGQGSLPA